MNPRVPFLAIACLLLAVPVPAAAQSIPGFDVVWGDSFTKVKNSNRYIIVGGNDHLAEMWQGDVKFNADKIDYDADTHKMIAIGHVQLTQAGSVIAADRMEFDTQTRTGIFYRAWGMASLGDRADKVFFGGMEPDMYFEGETVEKIGADTYKITHGSFTTCVQPVPRWKITSGTVIISLDHYAMLRNPVIRVKGVPVFYLPIIYYPTKKDDRATGFLLPSYGTSTVKGLTLSNAFFWAISRSQDLTIMHDWFRTTGQGFGGEYRYVRTPGSQGYLNAYLLNEHDVRYTAPDGSLAVQPAKRSYQLRGSANEAFSRNWRAGGRVSYFTDVISQQTYNTNILDASRGQRTIYGSLVGSWGGTSIRSTIERNDYFSSATESQLMAASPRVQLSRGERPIGKLPIYLGLAGEFVNLQRGITSASSTSSEAVSRIDFSPTVRVPFTKLPFLSINSSASWRGTYWSKSWAPLDHAILDRSVSRRVFELQSNISGPVVNRIFDTPKSGYAEKLKHTVEPFLNIRYTTSVDQFDRIIQWESTDSIVGGVTQLTYGLNNRLYAKRKRGGAASVAREILNVGISQSYYTDARASQFDRQYGTAFTGIKPYNFSPVAITARTSPGDRVNATLRAEIDARYKMLRTVSTAGNYSVGDWLQASGGWNITRFIADDGVVSGVNHFVSGSTTLRLADNHYGGNYAINFDVHQKQLVQQRFTLFYNAQCCGFAFDYQTFNFGNIPGLRVPRDTRFNFSFTLAGIGSFSNFFGALGGAPQR